jgi:hypothetical protein
MATTRELMASILSQFQELNSLVQPFGSDMVRDGRDYLDDEVAGAVFPNLEDIDRLMDEAIEVAQDVIRGRVRAQS